MSQDIYRGATGESTTSEFSGSGSDAYQGYRGEQDGGGASQTLDSLRDGARSAADQARERAAQFAEQGKEQLTEQIDEFAQAIRRAAESMREGEQAAPAQYVNQAADRLEELSKAIREKSVEEIMSSLQSFARRNRTAVFGGALLAGLVIGRFAVASSQNRSSGQSRSASQNRNAWRRSTWYDEQDLDFGSRDHQERSGVARSGTTSRSVGMGAI